MLKKICREQYEKDFDEMFKLDKKGLMTDIDCYVENLENKIKNLDGLYKNEVLKNEILKRGLKDLQQRIDKAIKDIDKLEKGIMNNTIIGFKQFIPEFKQIKEDLKGGKNE